MGEIRLLGLRAQLRDARGRTSAELALRDNRPVDRIERLRRAWRGEG